VLVTLDLAPYPASVGVARRFTIDTLRRWGRDDLTTTGALLVTELVTNAVLHARTMFQVGLERRDEIVRVEVRDGSPARPAQRNHGLDATTGRGLNLVARLATSWGVDMGGNGKVVWAHFAEDRNDEWADVTFNLSDVDDPDLDGPDEGRPPSSSGSDGDVRAHRVPRLGRCA
jgi:anti-sigma regulatory factor (Ser/Thr protein kinase)